MPACSATVKAGCAAHWACQVFFQGMPREGRVEGGGLGWMDGRVKLGACGCACCCVHLLMPPPQRLQMIVLLVQTQTPTQRGHPPDAQGKRLKPAKRGLGRFRHVRHDANQPAS